MKAQRAAISQTGAINLQQTCANSKQNRAMRIAKFNSSRRHHSTLEQPPISI